MSVSCFANPTHYNVPSHFSCNAAIAFSLFIIANGSNITRYYLDLVRNFWAFAKRLSQSTWSLLAEPRFFSESPIVPLQLVGWKDLKISLSSAVTFRPSTLPRLATALGRVLSICMFILSWLRTQFLHGTRYIIQSMKMNTPKAQILGPHTTSVVLAHRSLEQ